MTTKTEARSIVDVEEEKASLERPPQQLRGYLQVKHSAKRIMRKVRKKDRETFSKSLELIAKTDIVIVRQKGFLPISDHHQRVVTVKETRQRS